jgi:hypothetical protein
MRERLLDCLPSAPGFYSTLQQEWNTCTSLRPSKKCAPSVGPTRR